MSTQRILHNRVINVLSNNNYEYQFFIKDHLGNTRVVCKPDFNSNGTLKDKPTVLQRTDYYPFGMLHGGVDNNQPLGVNENRYLYNGKEYQARKWDNYGYTFYSSLHWYDYGARFYDAQLGRWHSVDPHAENYFGWSPYHYAANNPILVTDPTGKDWYIGEDRQLVWSPQTYNPETGEGTQSIQLASKVTNDEYGQVKDVKYKTYTWHAANGAARGTTTIKRFINEFLLSVFNENFEQIYIDSEYTGKDVWNYIIDQKSGMGAQMIGCLKQNKFVAKYRDEFLEKNKNNDNFWLYWDKNHVYSSKSFQLQWEYKNNNTKQKFVLHCVVKKNIKNGSLRCFGCSWLKQSKEILEKYRYRWEIENGIKDLTYSYFLNKIPSCEKPNLVNIHFLIVSICRHIYQMISQDAASELKNDDGSQKTLMTTRELLFRQGTAHISREQDTLNIYLANNFSINRQHFYNKFFKKITSEYPQGLQIIGGLKVNFIFKPPLGKEHKNSTSKDILDHQNFSET